MNQLFFETENNKIPNGLQGGTFHTRDGLRLRFALCAREKDTSPQGTVILLHGRNEAIERYYETITDLNKRGFCVATLDWRGQGGSDRILKDPQRGYVHQLTDYCTDLEQFLTEFVLPDCPPPFFILAHSTGALVCLNAHEMLQSRISRMVFVSPFLGLSRSIFSGKQLRPLASFLSNSGFGKFYAARISSQLPEKKFTNNPLTHDKERYLRNAAIIRDHPELGIDGPTIRWLAQALQAMRHIDNEAFFEGFCIPTLMLVAGADRVADSKAALRFAAKLHCATALTIDGARHELLQESDFYREQLWAAFDAFIPGSASQLRITEPVLTEVAL